MCGRPSVIVLTQAILTSHGHVSTIAPQTLAKSRLIRQRIDEFTKIAKTPSTSSTVVTSTLEDVPVELYTMILVGPADKLETEVLSTRLHLGNTSKRFHQLSRHFATFCE